VSEIDRSIAPHDDQVGVRSPSRPPQLSPRNELYQAVADLAANS
jgi:hypothetical protein